MLQSIIAKIALN